MRAKRIISLTAAALLTAQAAYIPVSAETYHSAHVTVYVYDSGTGELYDGEGYLRIGRGEQVGEGMGGGAMLGSWAPAEQNPYVTDLSYADGYLFRISLSGQGEYLIDESRCSPTFTLDNCTEKQIDLYLTGTENTTQQPESGDTAEVPDKSEVTFDDLLAMTDDELKAFCENNGLDYDPTIPSYHSRGMDVMLTPDDYNLTGEVTVSHDLSELGRGDMNDYDTGRMIADLAFPEEYYDVRTSVDFVNYEEGTPDGNGEMQETFYKLAAVGVGVKAGAEEKYSLERLLVLIPVWAGMNSNYRHFHIPVMGGGGRAVQPVKGDANTDGRINVSDAVTVLQYIANAEKYPLTPEGMENADCDGEAGLTGSDAIAIQKADAGIISLAPETEVRERSIEGAELLEVADIRYKLKNGGGRWSGSIVRSAEELEEFISSGEYDPVTVEAVSADTFADRAVIVLYSVAGSGMRYSVISGMTASGSTLNVSTVTREPEVLTCDMVARRYLISVPAGEAEGINGITFTDQFSCERDDGLGDVTEWFRTWLAGHIAG